MRVAIIFLTACLFWTTPELGNVRSAFSEAIEKEDKAVALDASLKQITKEVPVIYAYKGAVHCVLAKFRLNPYSQLELVRQGSECLDEAVREAPNNLEIRYLRYSVESNLPAILPYRKHIEQDRGRILYELSVHSKEIEPWLRKELAAYMLKNAQIDSQIRNQLEDLLN
ncbi:MAG: hypothetical protein GC180_11155 [Bacteroidetes bacterium]|nr:hypothetical protein [Bacteroidota bacterium]